MFKDWLSRASVVGVIAATGTIVVLLVAILTQDEGVIDFKFGLNGGQLRIERHVGNGLPLPPAQ